jgi:acetyl esterase/lipase
VLRVCLPGLLLGILVLPVGADQKIKLAYGPEQEQVLDLYTPGTQSDNLMPLVMLAHGGLWQSGGRGELEKLCRQIVKQSGNTLACASIDYRLSQDLGGSCTGTGTASYAGQVGDMALAFSFLQQNANQHALDPGNMFVGGHSAGAHLAQILNLRWHEFVQTCSGQNGCKPARGVIGIEGIYDITAWNSYDNTFWEGRFNCATRKAFGAPGPSPAACMEPRSGQRSWDWGSPLWLVQNAGGFAITPVADSLLVHSPEDNWVDKSEAINYTTALEAAFPESDIVVSTDGSCGRGQHNDVLADVALADCIAGFVAGRSKTPVSD